jgi:putative tryptophan/tyrosine transport system substrate-binding protein
MRRREFLWLLCYVVAASKPCLVLAQQATKVYRIAIVSSATPVSEINESHRFFGPLLEELRRLGYVEGQNLVVERYSAGVQLERYPAIVSDVVRSSPDVIFVVTTNLLLALKAQTTTIPIVAWAADPVAWGFAESLARPGGNITGSATLKEIEGKRLGLLKEAIPKLLRVGLLVPPTLTGQHGTAILKEASERAGISLVLAPLDSPYDETVYRGAFAAMVQEGAEAVYVGEQIENNANRRLIVELAERHGLPAIYFYREFADIGGLMAYENDMADVYRHAADALVQILKGTKPGDIPFYVVRKFNFVINMKTAKALNLDIPPTLLAQADEVIE